MSIAWSVRSNVSSSEVTESDISEKIELWKVQFRQLASELFCLERIPIHSLILREFEMLEIPRVDLGE